MTALEIYKAAQARIKWERLPIGEEPPIVSHDAYMAAAFNLAAQAANDQAVPVPLTDDQLLDAFNSSETVIDGLHEVARLIAHGITKGPTAPVQEPLVWKLKDKEFGCGLKAHITALEYNNNLFEIQRCYEFIGSVTTPPAQPAAPLEDDPFQAAVDWIWKVDGDALCAEDVASALRIEQNRAQSLLVAAQTRAAAPTKGDEV